MDSVETPIHYRTQGPLLSRGLWTDPRLRPPSAHANDGHTSLRLPGTRLRPRSSSPHQAPGPPLTLLVSSRHDSRPSRPSPSQNRPGRLRTSHHGRYGTACTRSFFPTSPRLDSRSCRSAGRASCHQQTLRSTLPFPIFNRKAGVCGRCFSAFYTFSTPVDGSVDNFPLTPANRPS